MLRMWTEQRFKGELDRKAKHSFCRNSVKQVLRLCMTRLCNWIEM